MEHFNTTRYTNTLYNHIREKVWLDEKHIVKQAPFLHPYDGSRLEVYEISLSKPSWEVNVNHVIIPDHAELLESMTEFIKNADSNVIVRINNYKQLKTLFSEELTLDLKETAKKAKCKVIFM